MCDVQQEEAQVGQHSRASGLALLAWTALRSSPRGGRRRVAARGADHGHRGRLRGLRVRAEGHGRRTIRVRDLPIGGRPVVLAWRKRIWRCRGSR
jgi:hypothetical protein